jgi:hypothetical protein
LSGDTVSLVSVDPARSLAFAVEHGRVFISGDRGLNWNALSDESRLGDFPLALHVVDGTPLRLLALFSGAGVMVQDIAPAEGQPVITALSDKQGGSRQ